MDYYIMSRGRKQDAKCFVSSLQLEHFTNFYNCCYGFRGTVHWSVCMGCNCGPCLENSNFVTSSVQIEPEICVQCSHLAVWDHMVFPVGALCRVLRFLASPRTIDMTQVVFFFSFFVRPFDSNFVIKSPFFSSLVCTLYWRVVKFVLIAVL
jgi:hypothetical protein